LAVAHRDRRRGGRGGRARVGIGGELPSAGGAGVCPSRPAPGFHTGTTTYPRARLMANPSGCMLQTEGRVMADATEEMVVGELRRKFTAAAVAISDLMQTCGRISADLAHYAGTVEADARAAGAKERRRDAPELL